MTWLDLVKEALRELGAIDSDETPATSDARTAFDSLNALIDQWKAEQRYIYQVTRTVWTIVSGTAAYTVGVGGTISISRPDTAAMIDRVNFLETSTDPDQEHLLDMMTDDIWSRVAQKALTSALPSKWHYNPTLTSSAYGTLTLWPVPTSTTLQGVFYAPQPISEATSLSATVALPSGYRRMIVTNLAVEIASKFGRTVDASLAQRAENAKETVKRSNKRLREMTIDGAMLLGRRAASYDIMAGE